MERLFAAVRSALPSDIACRVAISRFHSRGVLARIYNILEAAFRQGDVNHVIGDVHYLTFLLPKRKTVLTIHDCGKWAELRGWRKVLYGWLWVRGPIARAARITTISDATRQDLIRMASLAPERITVIPDCIPAEFQPAPAAFNAAKPRILQVGTRENKNLPMVIKALAGVPCHLEIVGQLTGDQQRSLAAHGIEYSNGVHLTDAELLERFRTCDLLIFVSTSEGFGMPIVEAQAIGRPVVTSAMSPMTDTGGEGACYVDPFDVEAIRAGVVRVAQDAEYRNDLISRGFMNVRRFQSKAIAEQYAEIYRRTAGAR